MSLDDYKSQADAAEHNGVLPHSLCHKFLIRGTAVVLLSATNDSTDYYNITMALKRLNKMGK